METINYLLGYKNLKIYQDTEMFSFSLDSVMLANFVTINKNISKIMDIGCGNAPIPLILSTKTPAQITGVEIQEEVYKLAVDSVKMNQLDDQIKIINDDINHLYLEYESDTFDVITCNPPYFKNSDNSKKNLSKYKEIARHEIYLNMNQVCEISRKLLKNNGALAIVQRPDRLLEILESMKKNNIEPKKIQFIYPKEGTLSNLVLVEGRKNGKPGLKILYPFFVHNADGTYTKEVKELFKSRGE